MGTSVTLGLQEAAAEYANTTLADMNRALIDMYGIDVMWFRTIPQKRSTDVIFQTYTLHNVESCPIELKVIYTDTNYDDAALTFSFNGIDYKPTLTLEIPVGVWYEATNKDGSLPQKRDIVFVPQTKKLWQVATMTPVAALGGQVTSFKMMMETYTPEADRLVGGELEEAINNNTVSVDELFGEAINSTMEDLTDKKQLSNKTSTEKDEYKDITKAKKPSEILKKKSVISTISGILEVDGHIVARSYYNMNMNTETVVEYKNIKDEVSIDDTRCLSIWANINKNEESEYNVESITENGKDRDFAYICVNSPISKIIKEGDLVKLYRKSIIIVGYVDSIDTNGTICIKTYIGMYKYVKNISDEWYSLKNFKIKKDSAINLLSGENENGEYGIDVLGRKYILLTLDGKYYVNPIDEELLEDNWYGYIINLSSEFNVNVFSCIDKLKKISESNIRIRWDDNVFNRYYMKSSNSYMTNIRYYSIGNYDIDKQLTDLVSYNIKNNSVAIINDSADIYIANSYYGEQR